MPCNDFAELARAVEAVHLYCVHHVIPCTGRVAAKAAAAGSTSFSSALRGARTRVHVSLDVLYRNSTGS